MRGIPENQIVEDEICVTIHGPGLPNFEFIDLPGIREFPAAMAQASKELASRYLKDQVIEVRPSFQACGPEESPCLLPAPLCSSLPGP